MGESTPGVQYWLGTIQPLRRESHVYEWVENLLTFVAGEMRGPIYAPLVQVENAAPLTIESSSWTPSSALACESVSTAKALPVEHGVARTPNSSALRFATVQALHQPGQHAAHRDAVKAVPIRVVVESFGPRWSKMPHSGPMVWYGS